MVNDKGQRAVNSEIVKVLSDLREKISCVSSDKAIFIVIDDFISQFNATQELAVSDQFKMQFLEDPMECTQQDFLEFSYTDDCKLCGSQRCLCDPAEYWEYAKFCGAFKNFLKHKEEDRK